MCTEDDFDAVCNKSDEDLIVSSKWVKLVESIPESTPHIGKHECILEEYLLDTVPEQKGTSRLYGQ